MIQALAIAAGDALGGGTALPGHRCGPRRLGRGFPYGTLRVNVIGSLLMGLLAVLLLERADPGPVWGAGVVVGLLGGFTTFSAFSMETFKLIQDGDGFKALLNVIMSVGLCVAAAALGLLIARPMQAL